MNPHFEFMNDRVKMLITNKGIIIDASLAFIWFLFFSWLLRAFVPVRTEPALTIWAVLAASCLTALFWLAINMFRIVWMDTRIEDDE